MNASDSHHLAVPSPVRHWFAASARVVRTSTCLTPGSSWRIDTDTGSYVVKTFAHDQFDADTGRLLAACHRGGFAPELMDTVAGDGYRWAIFQFVPGIAVHPNGPGWDEMLRQVPRVLQRLATCAPIPRDDLVVRWTHRFRTHRFTSPEVEAAKVDLLQGPPSTTRLVSAHGDVSPQNLLLVNGRVVLVDWAQVGCAPPGFDAGFFQAVVSNCWPWSRSPAHPDVAPNDLAWFAAFGVLRMLWRTETGLGQTELSRRMSAFLGARFRERVSRLEA